MSHPHDFIQEKLTQYNRYILGNHGHVLGIDLGGYGLRAALVDLHNHSYASAHSVLQGTDPEHVVAEALDMTRTLLAEHNVSPERLMRIGIGFGGPVNPNEGSIRMSPRMSGWENFYLKDYFEDAFDTVTLVDNDANLIALGEAVFGVGKDHNPLVYLHLSRGVGGGIIIDGRVYHGATAMAGEIGHAVTTHTAIQDGRPLMLEEVVSVSGLLQRANDAGLATDDLNDVFGDNPIGSSIVRDTIDLLALHLAQISVLLDPQMIVLGGIVVRIGGTPFVDAITERMQQYIDPKFARPVPTVASVLGVESIAIGAMALALESLRD